MLEKTTTDILSPKAVLHLPVIPSIITMHDSGFRSGRKIRLNFE